MLFTKEGQTLYLNSWCYNAVSIINRLSDMIEKNGGRVKKSNIGFIENRTFDEKIRELDDIIERAKNAMQDADTEKSEMLKKLIDANINEKRRYKGKTEKSRRGVSNLNYISFILDDTYYYLQLDSNPFFDHLFFKTPIIDGVKYNKDAACEQINTVWYSDALLYNTCTDAEIEAAAQKLYSVLTTAQNSPIIRDKYKRRVANTYNNGYHYETVYSANVYKTIDF